MTSPYLPMLFMGEEWSEPHPFLYFVSHTDPGLAEAVRKGRKEEFAAFHAVGEAPDPVAEETFLQSKLQWTLLSEEPHQTMHRYYKTLIHLRKTHPALSHSNRKQLHVEHNRKHQTLILHRWHENKHVLCLMNFSKKAQYVMPPSYAEQWHKLFDSADPQWLGPASASQSMSGAKPGSSTVALQPESILIYEN
jgi:maltooligosyltrehalose trehalohydrolase